MSLTNVTEIFDNFYAKIRGMCTMQKILGWHCSILKFSYTRNFPSVLTLGLILAQTAVLPKDLTSLFICYKYILGIQNKAFFFNIFLGLDFGLVNHVIKSGFYTIFSSLKVKLLSSLHFIKVPTLGVSPSLVSRYCEGYSFL